MTFEDLFTFTNSSVPIDSKECLNRTENIQIIPQDIQYCGQFDYGCEMDGAYATCDSGHFRQFPYPIVVKFDGNRDE